MKPALKLDKVTNIFHENIVKVKDGILVRFVNEKLMKSQIRIKE